MIVGFKRDKDRADITNARMNMEKDYVISMEHVMIFKLANELQKVKDEEYEFLSKPIPG